MTPIIKEETVVHVCFLVLTVNYVIYGLPNRGAVLKKTVVPYGPFISLIVIISEI